MHDAAQYAVIFVSQRTDVDDEGYAAMAERMVELARTQEGFVDIHSTRDESGKGITVSYWSSLEAIQNWKKHAEHLVAQKIGRQRWYQSYDIAIAKIERHSEFDGK